jgi:hypothetical protein
MEVRQFMQGASDATLFGLVGPWLSSRAIHVDQAAPITSEPGDMWHVATEAANPVGFALTNPTKDGAHIKNVWADTSRGRDALLKAVLKSLQALKLERAYSVGRSSDELWSRNGFKFIKGRGQFGTWERRP